MEIIFTAGCRSNLIEAKQQSDLKSDVARTANLEATYPDFFKNVLGLVDFKTAASFVFSWIWVFYKFPDHFLRNGHEMVWPFK